MGTITLTAPYSTGTANATNGSTTVTGTDTVWTASMVGRKIKIDGTEEYTIATRVGNTEITIDRAYVGATVTDKTYVIYQNEYSLATDVRSIQRIWDITNDRMLYNDTIPNLSTYNYQKSHYGSDVRYYAEFSRIRSTGALTLFVYPYPNGAATCRVLYFRRPTPVETIGDTVDITSDLEEVLVQGLYWRYLQILGNGKEIWGPQKGEWTDLMEDAFLRDQSGGDFKVLMNRMDADELWDIVPHYTRDTIVAV